MWSQSLKFNCLHRYLFFIFSVHDYSQNLVLQKTRMQTVALKVNFPLFLFGGIYSFSLFSEFWPLSALQHKCTSPWIPWLQCVDLSDSCSGPLRHFVQDSWTLVLSWGLNSLMSLRTETPHHLPSTVQQDCPDILFRKTAPDREENVWRLFTISHYFT